MKTLGIIGTGNMASAMLNGAMKEGRLKPDEVVVFNRTASKAIDLCNQYEGISLGDSAEAVVSASKYILLGVKPNQHQGLIERIKTLMTPEKVIILIAAGLSIEGVRYWFGDDVKVARTMPNTPARVGAAMTAVCFSDGMTQEEMNWVTVFLESFGAVEVIEEKLMDAVPAISGSAPAYMFQMIEAMADEGVRQGFNRQQAYRMAAQAMLGASKMVLETGLHPAVLKDQVTSPGGTTIEALKVLEIEGFRQSVMKAMEACTDKTKRLMNK